MCGDGNDLREGKVKMKMKEKEGEMLEEHP